MTTSLLPAQSSAKRVFVDQARELGVEFSYFNGMTGRRYLVEIVGGGVALFDFDGDGDLDLYLVQGGLLGSGRDQPLVPAPARPGGRLFRNDMRPDDPTSLQFTDVTAAAGIRADGYGMGVAVGDYNVDGLPDLFLTNFGPNQLWRNNGDSTFSDVTADAGLADHDWSVPASFLDYDRDGLPDLYVGNYLEYSLATNKPCQSIAGGDDYCGPLSYEPAADRLWRNLGDGTFKDVSSTAGIANNPGSTLGAVSGDFNEDGWPDIYVANDGLPNNLWINQTDGTFGDQGLISGTALNASARAEAGMGVDAGDYDADGRRDLFLTHLYQESNTLYRNLGDGLFEDSTSSAGLATLSWESTGFGTVWLDYDNDGRLDLAVANGDVHLTHEQPDIDHPLPLHQPNQLFHNAGSGRFLNATARAGGEMATPEVSRGLAVGDLDNDGDPDLVLSNIAGPTRLLINQIGSHSHWIGLRLTEGDPDRIALGARAALLREGRAVTWRWLRVDGSYASAHDPRLLFGLGQEGGAVTVRVVWSDGTTEDWLDLEARRYHHLRRGSGTQADQ